MPRLYSLLRYQDGACVAMIPAARRESSRALNSAAVGALPAALATAAPCFTVPALVVVAVAPPEVFRSPVTSRLVNLVYSAMVTPP